MPSPNRYFSSTASRSSLQTAVSATIETLTVTSVAGFPASTPFTLVLDSGKPIEEIVTVTAISGLTLNVIRGEDGTSAAPHDVAADVVHALTARDLREPQEHIAATTGAHGVVGAFVGTTAIQSLTNKTFDASKNNLTNVPKSAMPTDTVYTAATQTLTNKNVDGGSNNLTNVPAAAISGLVWTDFNPTLAHKPAGSIAPISYTKLYGRWAQMGDLVFAFAAVTAGGTTVGGCHIHLPVAAHALFRPLAVGSLAVSGSNPPADQSGLARVSAEDQQYLVVVAPSNGFRNVDSGDVVQYAVTYRRA